MKGDSAALDQTDELHLFEKSKSMWHPVATSEELGTLPIPVQLLDTALVIVRLGEKVSVFPDICIHRGTALSLGKVIDGNLQCAYHGWKFNSSGKCVSIPARPSGSIPLKAQLKEIASVEQNGLIWVCLSGEPLFDIPVFPQINNPEYRTVTIPTYDWNSSAARRIENFIDFSHFAFVHEGILGTPDKAEIPDYDVMRIKNLLTFDLGVEEPANELKGDKDLTEVLKRIPSTYTITMPYSVLLDQPLGDGSTHFILFMASQPISAKKTRTFCFCARNYDMDPAKDSTFIDFQNLILEQDRIVVESQRPEELPIDLSEELHIKGVDRVSIEYRKWLKEIVG
jgi:vanillate O-demethylase monooxygenase subunit